MNNISELEILNIAERFARHVNTPLTENLIAVAYDTATTFKYVPTYVLHNAIKLGHEKNLFGTIPKQLTY